jgi:hypothetical protein
MSAEFPLKLWIRIRIQSTTLDVRGRYLLVKDEGGAGGDVKELEPGHSQALCLELQVLCSRQSWNSNFSPRTNGQERVIMYHVGAVNLDDPCFAKPD